MGLSLDYPWMLLALPLAFLAARGTRGWTRGERAYLAVLAGAIALALASPRLGDAPAPRHVWIAVDRSASATDRPGGRDWIAQAQVLLATLEPDDHAGLLMFGANAAVVAGPGPPADLARRLGSLTAAIDPDASDLGACLQLADRAGGNAGEVLIVGDGRDTPGATSYTPPDGRRISALIPGEAHDWRIRRVDAPARLAPGEPCRMNVVIESTARGRARLFLARDGRRVHEIAIEHAAPGRTTTILADTPDDSGGLGRIDYRLELEADPPDSWPGNERMDVPVELEERRRILWVTSDPEGPWTAHWTRVLARIARLEPTAPEGVGRRLEDSRGVDAVALVDVAAETVGEASQEALARFVERGGGLVFVGGRASLSGGGYLRGRVESVLPVHLGPRPDDEPAGVAILVDCSGSMDESVGGSRKLALARAGAIEVARAVELGTRVGVWTFAIEPREVEPFSIVGDEAAREALAARLRAGRASDWAPSGGTNIAKALDTVIRELQRVHPRGPRHAILVSDGASDHVVAQEGELTRLLTARGQEVVLGVVHVGGKPAVGDEALRRLAAASGGPFVAVRALDEVPRTMLDGYRRARRGLVADAGRRAVPGPAFDRAVGLALPGAPLGELGRTPARGEGEAVLAEAATDGAEAIPLAAWRELEGGGRTGYVQLGAGGDRTWGADGEDERGRGDGVVAACAAWVLDRATMDLAWQLEFDDGVLDAWVRESERALAAPGHARTGYVVRAAGGAFLLEPRGRGLWGATLALSSGLHTLELLRLEGEGRSQPTGLSRTIAIPYARELARTETDVPRLAALARETGGAVLERADQYRPAARARQPGRPCAAELLLVAAGLVIAHAVRMGLGRA